MYHRETGIKKKVQVFRVQQPRDRDATPDRSGVVLSCISIRLMEAMYNHSPLSVLLGLAPSSYVQPPKQGILQPSANLCYYLSGLPK